MPLDILALLGNLFAIAGSVISIVGVYHNNIRRDHFGAMKYWMFSNVFLMAWAYGYVLNLWNGGLSVVALAVIYTIFTVTNVYGVIQGVCEGCHYNTKYNHCAVSGCRPTFREKARILVRGCPHYYRNDSKEMNL